MTFYRDIFHKAKLASPCIIFLDEIDSIAPRRGGGEASAVTDRVIAQLLTEMDGIEELNGVLVLAATNRKDLVDPALLRAGRFDFVLELPLPDADARKQIFGVHTQDKPLADDVRIDILAGEASNGWNGADIEFACRRAGTLAIRDYLALHPSPPPNLDTFRIWQKHFDEAVQAVRQKE